MASHVVSQVMNKSRPGFKGRESGFPAQFRQGSFGDGQRWKTWLESKQRQSEVNHGGMGSLFHLTIRLKSAWGIPYKPEPQHDSVYCVVKLMNQSESLQTWRTCDSRGLEPKWGENGQVSMTLMWKGVHVFSLGLWGGRDG
eukprot:CAMPEP_0201486606 /NCGR_PEP_ID=MMETSP0151_2-20130828/10670_1 /ASSEMBLY_ACC=CAM_ASM_000257 /TAXON_ID=200890 /ORGANISM="Paramoeba atlantica, Strain 621/1 / CCAP 1560/9" /LENGTH=140 /DNA_ID=CAMNT_0047871337 /DNA_START=136 /DNA_END=554 /DNA_ORIENTATION=-